MSYKYSCRDCPIRERCIVQSDTASRVKDMIRNAFAARTDTLSTWGVLQKNCLLIKEDEERERRANQESLLRRRIREAKDQEVPPEAEPASPPPPAEAPPREQMPVPPSRWQKAGTTRLSEMPEGLAWPAHPAPSPVEEIPPVVESRFEKYLESSLLSRQSSEDWLDPYWLTVMMSKRHIGLPATGGLVLGRFDPGLPNPPDVDLTHEDQQFLTVSRLHAKVIGVNGRYSIKDLGSSNGLFVNGEPVTPGLARPLHPGDHVALGYLQLLFERVPAQLQDAAHLAPGRHFLMITFSGRKLLIEPPDSLIIGSVPPSSPGAPDINLSSEAEVAQRVAEQHVTLSWRNGRPYLEDLSSPAGTRINGESLPPHRPVPLRPGDHIWLGGCVLAYDVRL